MRLIAAVLGSITVAWLVLVWPALWLEPAVKEAAARILGGETYRPDALAALTAADWQETHHRPSSVANLAVLRLRQAEDLLAAGDPSQLEERLGAARQTIQVALSDVPTDSFMWLALFWIEDRTMTGGLGPLKLLRMSYDCGPHEGWLATRRAPVTLSRYASLSPELREAALLEFVGLVRSKMYVDAAEVAHKAGRMLRYILFARLKDVGEPERRIFARVLYDRNLDDVPVPQIDARPVRPWR